MTEDFKNGFLQELREKVSKDPQFLSLEPSELEEFGKDWTKVYKPNPLAVVFPRTTQEVSQVMRLCHNQGVAVVPSGGRTGLAGGAVAANGELVISLKRMNRMDPVDTTALTLKVQGGAITEAVHKHCEPHGLTWPVDFASKGSSHVGGNIATNAGGVNVIRYGLTRQWVLGLQVVLANGEVIELNGALEKNNTGFDLRQLFIGTEGTLGIITEATLKLTKLFLHKKVMLFSVTDIAAVLNLFREARVGPFTLNAFEFLTDFCLERVLKNRKFPVPFEKRTGCYVLIDVDQPEKEDVLEGWVEKVFEKGLVHDGLLAQNDKEAQQFWAYRESVAESLFATGLPHKNDVSLPIAGLEGFCGELDRFFSEHYPDYEIANFGHIGDGNLHINIMKPDHLEKAEFLKRTHQVDHDLFKMVRKYGGSISAEHGVGLLKKDFLSYSRTPAEMTLLKAVKTALDPKGILNPGKIF